MAGAVGAVIAKAGALGAGAACTNSGSAPASQAVVTNKYAAFTRCPPYWVRLGLRDAAEWLLESQSRPSTPTCAFRFRSTTSEPLSRTHCPRRTQLLPGSFIPIRHLKKG